MATKKDNNAAQDAATKALAAVQAKKNAEKAAKTAEKSKVQHTITHVGQQSEGKEELLAITKKNALPYRIGAIILWVLAIGFEVLAILLFKRVIQFSFTTENPGWWLAWGGALLLDLVCVIIGSQLWKKGNHLDPASAKNKTRFWLHNNLGVIVSVVAFVPFIILVLLDKNADKKSKTIAAIAAAVALVIAGLTSVDWNPVSQEELLEAAGLGNNVYWTQSGTVYHAYEDCGSLNHSSELFEGTTQAAIENGKTRMCKFCEARAEKEAEEIPGDTGTDKVETPTDEVVAPAE